MQDLSVFKNKCGVYKIFLPDANICYIGSSKNIYKILSHHLRDLNKQSHYNAKLQFNWSHNYELSILEECDQETLLNKEEEWIKKTHNCVSRFFYSDHSSLIDEYLKKRLFDKIIKKDNDCWIYTGKKRDEYGRIQSHGKTLLVHRVIFFIYNNYYPYFVHHTCGNKSCCNPDHLSTNDNLSNKFLNREEFKKKFCDTYKELDGHKWLIIEKLNIGESVYHTLKRKFFKGQSYRHVLITAFGKSKTAKDWCLDEQCGQGVTPALIRNRILNGISPEKAIITPNKSEKIYQDIKEARGLFIYGYPLKLIHPKLSIEVRKYNGPFNYPNDPKKYTYFINQDLNINIHARLGKFYYVIDGSISEPFEGYIECLMILEKTSGHIEVTKELDKYKLAKSYFTESTPAEIGRYPTIRT